MGNDVRYLEKQMVVGEELENVQKRQPRCGDVLVHMVAGSTRRRSLSGREPTGPRLCLPRS